MAEDPGKTLDETQASDREIAVSLQSFPQATQAAELRIASTAAGHEYGTVIRMRRTGLVDLIRLAPEPVSYTHLTA